MSSVTFPNGLTLTSTALSVSDIQDLFQQAVIQMLGLATGSVTTATLTAGSNQATLGSIGTAGVGNLIAGRGIAMDTVIRSISGNVVTMSANAAFPGTYGTGGYADMDYGTPSTWTATVAMGLDLSAYSKVRVGWQLEGQPGWGAKDNIVAITGVVVDDPYNRIRDIKNALNDETTVMQATSYTRCWEMRFSCYGPSSADNARLIKSCLRLDWVRNIASGSNLYLVPNEADPMRAPENFNAQWWDRSDFRARYYEGVQETITQQTVATAEVIVEGALGGYGAEGYGDNPYGDPTTVVIDFTASAPASS